MPQQAATPDHTTPNQCQQHKHTDAITIRTLSGGLQTTDTARGCSLEGSVQLELSSVDRHSGVQNKGSISHIHESVLIASASTRVEVQMHLHQDAARYIVGILCMHMCAHPEYRRMGQPSRSPDLAGEQDLLAEGLMNNVLKRMRSIYCADSDPLGLVWATTTWPSPGTSGHRWYLLSRAIALLLNLMMMTERLYGSVCWIFHAASTLHTHGTSSPAKADRNSSSRWDGDETAPTMAKTKRHNSASIELVEKPHRENEGNVGAHSAGKPLLTRYPFTIPATK